MTGPEDVGGGTVATQPLREDYAAVEPVLSGMTLLAERVRGGHSPHALLLVGALTYLEAFQRRHDQKVEEVLLPALEGDEVSRVTGEVIQAHRDERRRIAELRRAAQRAHGLNAALCRLAAEYVVCFRAHAASESEVLFAHADRVLSPDQARRLWEAFRQIDERESRPGERRALGALADAIDPRRAPASEAVATADVVAAHVMRPWPHVVHRADTLARATELMDRSHVRELAVVEDGRLCGILSRTDVLMHAGHLEWTTVETAMTSQPVVVTPEQPVGVVSKVLLRGRFNAVPVVAEDATLVGMISRSDLLQAVVNDATRNGR